MGDPFSPNVEVAAGDLAAANYYVLVVTHREAPCQLITGQHCHNDTPLGIQSGRPPQQTNDIKALVNAARADMAHCNGFVAIVGGSSGATHAIWTALDQASTSPAGAWPYWSKASRVNAAACLSGAYLFSDETPQPDYRVDPLPNFNSFIYNYTNSLDLDVRASLSPVTLLTTSTADIKPLFIITSEFDPMPRNQIVDIGNALQTAGVNTLLYTIKPPIPDSNEHAFAYWHSLDGPGGQLVSVDVINFLNAQPNP